MNEIQAEEDIELKKNEKIYKIHNYIDGDKLVMEIENDASEYSNQYEFQKLQEFKYFRMSENLNEALNDMKTLLIDYVDEISIELKGNNLELIIPHKKGDMKFLLNQIDDNINISYDNLSPEMKKIIDKNELILGIDLGTTLSCASVMIDKNIIMIRNSLGSTTTPSFIAFLSKNEVYVGELAKLLPSNARNIIYNTKRLLGKNFDEKEIKELINSLSFKLKNHQETNLLQIELDFNEEDESTDGKSKKEKRRKTQEEIAKEEEEKRYFFPEQICALILKKIVKDSEFYLSKKIGKEIHIKNCIITVPAYFNQKQREATLNSAKIIGLNVKTMINEPTSASLAYGYNNKGNAEKEIIVIDFGGGTLDITLLKYTKNEEGIYCNVLSTYGDTNFGGEDFDKILMAKCKEKFLEQNPNNTFAFREKLNNVRLKRACERAKIKLSDLEETKIHLENYIQYQSFDFSLRKEEFIEYCKDLFDKFETILNEFLNKSKTNKDNINEVILIGGSTLIPKIKEIIANKFNKSKINCHLNPKEVVAMGAAIRGGIFLKLKSIKEINLFDVTNLSLGIKEYENKFGKIINRSTKIPCDKIVPYKTAVDNQTSVLVEVYEGEGDKKCNENNLLLDQFRVTGLPKKKAGEVKIQVRFRINENSILEVSAWEKHNEANKNTKKIERLCNLDLDWLKHLLDDIYFKENKEYNKIKLSIIEIEENVTKQKSEEKLNKEAIKSLNKSILEKVGNFLKNTQEDSNLYISFIKYYFNKICEYYQYYNENSNDDINDFNNTKENIKIIFDKIQLMNSDLIYEIIEEFVDLDNLYKSFVDFILKSYYGKITEIFYSTNSVIKGKTSNLYEKTLKELNEIEKITEICIGLINKFNLNINNTIQLNLKDLENMKLKIKVRKEIIKDWNTWILKKIFTSSKEKLTDLFNQYYQCDTYEEDDLKELKILIGKNDINNNAQANENFEVEFQKACNFNEWIRMQTNNFNEKEISNTISRILTDYPYCEKKDEDNMWDIFHLYKSNQMSLNNYLNKIKSQYKKLFDDENTDDIKKEVYNNILIFLNALG